MITRGASDPASAPNSPSSRAVTAPSDSEPPAAPAAAASVVDFTGEDEPWTTAPARRTSEPTPLARSKRPPTKTAIGTVVPEKSKGKRRLARRPAVGTAAAKKVTTGGEHDSDASLEDKPAPPPVKKPRKTPAAAKTPAAKAPAAKAQTDEIPAHAETVASVTSHQPTRASRSGGGFDLGTFMASFEPGLVSGAPAPPTVTTTATSQSREEQHPPSSAEMAAQMRELQLEIQRLRTLVASQTTVQVPRATTFQATPASLTPTAPNAAGGLPPPEVRYLSSASFPEGAKKAKGDYNPPQAHLLAASRMFRSFGTEAGTTMSAMSFVLMLRELPSAKFQVSPAVLMAIFSGRLGSRGLTLMHFKEASEMTSLEDGSTNANFSNDFSPSASLPPATTRCSSYEDILDALHGLTALGEDVWYQHMMSLMSRIRTFVAKNKSADPSNSPTRVRLTLLYANKFLGAALGHLQADDSQWWYGFSQALCTSDYESPAWTIALVGALAQVKDRKDSKEHQTHGSRGSGRQDTGRRPAVPEAIRRLIPVNRRGQEPCLLNVAGLPCSGGSRGRCGNPRRLHNWPERLPSRLLEWVERTYDAETPNSQFGSDTLDGAATVHTGALTLRSGTAIQPPPAIQLPLTIQSGLTIQSPAAIQPVPAIQPVQILLPRGKVPSPPQPDQVPQRPDSKLMDAGRAAPTASLRRVVSPSTAAKWHANALERSNLLRKIGRATLAKAMSKKGIVLPPDDYPVSRDGDAGPEFLLNKPLQHALSELARRTGATLPAFVELVRGQTPSDYRPNKNLVPEVLEKLCKDYKHLDALLKIAQEGVQVRLKKPPPIQGHRPPNHGSAKDRLNVLRKNIRKEQDAGRCLVLDKNLLEQWPEIIISPFGVVDKGHEDAASSGRTIHDLSFPEGASINDLTDQDSITKPDYAHCDAVATEILRLKRAHRESNICVMAGDVASAFRNIGIHSNSVYLFAGHIEEDDVIVIELVAPFGWTGSPGYYEIAGGAIAHVHGSHANDVSPSGFFNYHWVDDHINVAADIGTNCDDTDRSLRFAIAAVLGADAINTKKFTTWNTRQRVLGLEFDSLMEQVSMPAEKIEKARHIVATAHSASTLSRKEYRSLMGSLRHVATCIRAARPFLQRLRQRESRLHRFQSVSVTNDMRQDLLWWWLVLHTPHLNGVSLGYFNTLPPPDVVVEMDASDYGLCALDVASQQALTYQFSSSERSLIGEFKEGVPNGFDINFRELLSCAFAVHAWGPRWSAHGARSGRPRHVHFCIDNTSAVAWQNKLASRNPRAQVIIRLISWWETSHSLRFSASHVAGVENERADAGSRIAANPSFSAKFASLTPGWLQVKPTIDTQGLADIWLRISERTPLPTPHLTSTAER